MKISRFHAGTLLCAALALGSNAAFGQAYPQRPVRIVTAEAGSGNDFIARLIAAGITGPLGQPVIVDNRGGQIIPAATAARASPDGHTLLVSSSTLWLAPFLQADVPYDPLRDFAPVTLATTSPNLLVVQGLPVKSVKELIALAKARPGQINCALGPKGGSVHLAAELFRTTTGTNIVGVPYRGVAQALNALLGGEVQLMFPNVALATPHIKSGRLNALAITSAKPSALAPGLPTLAESGLPGFQSGAMFGLFVPARTPESIVDRLNREVVRVLDQPGTRQKLFNLGSEVVTNSPQEFAALVKSEMAKWGKVIKEAGIRAE